MTVAFRRRSFAVRYLTLLGGEAFGKLCVFASFAYLARALGPRQFGIVELALSITVFCVLGAESGLGSYGARMVEQSPRTVPQLIPRVIVLRGILSLPAYVVILVVSQRQGMPGIGVLAIYGVIVLLTPFFTQWVFQGLRQMQWVAAGSALRYGVFALIVLSFVRPGSDVRLVALAEVCGAAALVLFNAVLLHRVVAMRLDWSGVWRGARRLLGEGWFLGASDLTWATMWYSPTLIVGWIASARAEEVAWLAASVRIVMSLHTFVWLYFFNMIPNLSKELHQGVDGWRMLVHRSLSVSIWAPCLIALGGTLLAPFLVTTVYGPAFERAALPLQIIIWLIPIMWLSGHFRFSLIAAGHQRLEFAASALSAAATLALAVFGVSFHGVAGAATALLAGSVLNAVLAGMFMSRAIGPVRLRFAAAPVLACAVAVLVGLAVTGLTRPLVGAASAFLLYGVAAASRLNLTRFKLAWEGRFD